MADNETDQTADETTDAAVAQGEPEPEPALAQDEPEAEAAAKGESKDEDEVFVEDPIFNVDYKGDCAYEVTVTIPPANQAKQAEEMYDELENEAQVPGFRKGRVPRRLLERKFAKVVRGEVEGRLVNAAFQKLVKDQDLHPISLPGIEGLEENKERPDGEPLTFTLKFEVAPRVELGRYREIEIERPILKVDDQDVSETLDNMRSRYGVYEDVDDPAQDGDQVVIDFRGTIEGEEFPGGSASSYPYVLGSGRFFREFEEGLRGAAAGQELTVQVTFPEDYSNENLRGKAADFTIQAKQVKRRALPELDDDFAKQAGHESLDDMRQKVAEQLRAGVENQTRQVVEERALQAVVESSTFEIPEGMIERVAKAHQEDEVRRLLSMRVPMDQIQAREEELREHSRQHAIREIQRVVALDEIAEVEGLEVTDEDLEQELHEAAYRYGFDPASFVQYMSEDEERRSSYEDRVLRVKAVNVIVEHANITDKELTREELDKEAGETPEGEAGD